jgi:MerR family transcriptional regulator, copper efflux regulator
MRKGMTESIQNILGSTNGSHYLRVGDLARQAGKTVRAIHLYEELGLLEPATRSSGGFRLYHPAAVERVRWIDLFNGLGMSLQETREVLERWWKSDRGPEAMDELRALFGAKLEVTRDNIRRQQELEQELVKGLAYLETCRVCGEPGAVDRCVSCTQDHGPDAEPALVAGFKGAKDGARRVIRPVLVQVQEHS